MSELGDLLGRVPWASALPWLATLGAVLWGLFHQRARRREAAEAVRVGELEALERARLRAVAEEAKRKSEAAREERAGEASAAAAVGAHPEGAVDLAEVNAELARYRSRGGGS